MRRLDLGMRPTRRGNGTFSRTACRRSNQWSLERESTIDRPVFLPAERNRRDKPEAQERKRRRLRHGGRSGKSRSRSRWSFWG